MKQKLFANECAAQFPPKISQFTTHFPKRCRIFKGFPATCDIRQCIWLHLEIEATRRLGTRWTTKIKTQKKMYIQMQIKTVTNLVVALQLMAATTISGALFFAIGLPILFHSKAHCKNPTGTLYYTMIQTWKMLHSVHTKKHPY